MKFPRFARSDSVVLRAGACLILFAVRAQASIITDQVTVDVGIVHDLGAGAVGRAVDPGAPPDDIRTIEAAQTITVG
jgi:hypothetical protein